MPRLSTGSICKLSAAKRLMTNSAALPKSWLNEEAFSAACAALPLISVDWIITNPDQQLLLGLRNNRPGRDYWFTPGGRIRKNEVFSEACRRIAQEELGLNPNMARAQLMGVWDHFYPDSAFADDVSTHYVNLPHWLPLSWPEIAALTLNLNDQHRAWRWLSAQAASTDASVNPYAQNYAHWLISHF